MRDPSQKLYRFWGRVSPERNTARTVVRAEVLTTTEGAASLYIYGPIDSWGGVWGVSATEVAAALAVLDRDVTQLDVHINSPGGEVFEGIAIMNLLRNHAARIVSHVDALAASAASYIAVSADECVMGENSELMIHDAWGFCIGNAAEMHEYADFLSRTSDNIADVYAKKAGGTRQEWREYMTQESWFGASEAVEAGLADRVAGAEDELEPADEPAARQRYDTAALFQYSGRSDAPDPAPVPSGTNHNSVPETTSDDDPGVSLDLTLRHRHNARKIGLKL